VDHIRRLVRIPGHAGQPLRRAGGQPLGDAGVAEHQPGHPRPGEPASGDRGGDQQHPPGVGRQAGDPPRPLLRAATHPHPPPRPTARRPPPPPARSPPPPAPPSCQASRLTRAATPAYVTVTPANTPAGAPGVRAACAANNSASVATGTSRPVSFHSTNTR